jgi:hypothetical protein
LIAQFSPQLVRSAERAHQTRNEIISELPQDYLRGLIKVASIEYLARRVNCSTLAALHVHYRPEFVFLVSWITGLRMQIFRIAPDHVVRASRVVCLAKDPVATGGVLINK